MKVEVKSNVEVTLTQDELAELIYKKIRADHGIEVYREKAKFAYDAQNKIITINASLQLLV